MMTFTIAPEWTNNLDLSQESSLKSGFLVGWKMQPLRAKGKCAKPSKTTQNPKASNMVELTKIYFACYTKIHKSMSDEFSVNTTGVLYLLYSKNLKEYSDNSVKKGCRLLFTLLFWRIEMLTNNQINLTTAGNLIKKKAVDKAKESMAVLEICANKVGVQPNECLAGDLACNCVVDQNIFFQFRMVHLTGRDFEIQVLSPYVWTISRSGDTECSPDVTPNLHSGSSSPSNGEQEEASTSKKQTFIYYTLPLISVPSAPNSSTPNQLHLPLPPIPKEPPTVQANPSDIWMHIHSPRTEDLYFHPRRQLPGFPQTLGNLSSGFRSYLETGLALEEK
uniref:Uncharacterized protein n=1 Tax=Timema bartmani TaxID=61472 RepID=A0A7R9F7A5_9NEOP|nr:unnamed protein product [Timema bartmani]